MPKYSFSLVYSACHHHHVNMAETFSRFLLLLISLYEFIPAESILDLADMTWDLQIKFQFVSQQYKL